MKKVTDEELQETTDGTKDIDVNFEEVQSVEEALKAKAEELKKTHKLKEVFHITSGDKACWVKRPSRDQMKYATQVAKGNILELAEQVLRSGFLEGDREIIDDDFYFYGVTEQIEQILETSTAQLKKF